MRKNRMMRLASILMIAVLMTTCTISGTFAKYVTEGSASDDARVAKWGVEITTDGVLFGEQYKNEIVAADDTNLTVQVYNYSDATVDNVVAPGTENSTGLTFTLTGKPEVDVNVAVAVEATDIVLAAANDTYLDYTTAAVDDKFDLASDYHPVVFTLKNGLGVELVSGTIAQIEDYLEDLSGDYDSNTDLATIAGLGNDGTYILTWEWAFDVNPAVVDVYDKADTFLGNQAPLQEVEFGITITVTQID